MRKLKRVLAAFLAAALMVPAGPVMALEKLPEGTEQQTMSTAEPRGEKKEVPGKEKVETSSNADKEDEPQSPVQPPSAGQGNEDLGIDQPSAGQGTENPGIDRPNEGQPLIPMVDAGKVKPRKQEQVSFNTGSHKYTIVSQEDFWDNGLGDDCFEEDGSYMIHIPEENPFFPYEVQFTAEGKVTKEWFMTPDDSVDIAGHTFYVDAFFDDTAMTQMSLEIGGDTVIVYPEKKKFTDEDGAMPLSLLPLEEVKLTVDLTGYTPVELTQVSLEQIFTGEYQLTADDQVMWRPHSSGRTFAASNVGEKINLSSYTYSGGTTWEMIVGENDQLASANIRYLVDLKTANTSQWLIPTVYGQDSQGNRTEVPIIKEYYQDWPALKRLILSMGRNQGTEEHQMFLGVKINPEIYPTTKYDEIKAFQGAFDTVEEAEAGNEVTAQLFGEGHAEAGGFPLDTTANRETITFVTYQSGNATGILNVRLQARVTTNRMIPSLYAETEDGRTEISYETGSSQYDGRISQFINLEPGYEANGQYSLVLQYIKNGEESNQSVTAAYAGEFESISTAQDAKAEDIRGTLFDEKTGYKTDYSQGVTFSIFIGEDNMEGQEVYRYRVITEETVEQAPASLDLGVRFTGINDAKGNLLNSYSVDVLEDSYSEYNFITMLVGEDADLTKLAPVFDLDQGVTLYAAGGNTPETSGASLHDFSKGTVQYTASDKNNEGSKNYWLRILKVGSEKNRLYINSLEDVEAQTRVENGVIYSTREMFLDTRHDFIHDIVLINAGKEELSNLTAELDSQAVELDDYWTLKGDHALGGFTAVVSPEGSQSGLYNLAKIRLQAKDITEETWNVSGTLTIKNAGQTLMVLTLTGVVGDPVITTEEIPAAVKYVPYGTMIQNSNKYSWNRVRYTLDDGELPEGIELKANGELYGVPKETGEFTFSVCMTNSIDDFSESYRTFTLIVRENTDTNVEMANDKGYMVIQRIPDISLADTKDYTLVSAGLYSEFVDVFLDGEKLAEGTDYDSESGSTRITIRSQTLKASNQTGTHTLGVEFRTGEEKTLKRAAQNYKVTKETEGGSGTETGGDSESGGDSGNSETGGTSGGNSGSGNSGGSSGGNSGSGSGSSGGNSGSSGSSGNGSSGGSGGGGSSSSSKSQTNSVDTKKGHVDAVKGIITGDGAGYSSWIKDEYGWKLRYADGTYAAGAMVKQPGAPEEADKQVEQVLWEKVNGAWYPFGADQYLKSGWVFDYSDSKWYSVSVDSGMRTGWYQDPMDGYFYYLLPESGAMALGWRQIEEKWYYLNKIVSEPTWNFDERTGSWVYNILTDHQPYGSLYRNKMTPDGYLVDKDGVWMESHQ